jgi:outer membrane protein assembly factor BamB
MSAVAPSDERSVAHAHFDRRRVLAGTGALGLSALLLPPTSAHASGTLELTANETQLLLNADFDEGTQHWTTSTTWSTEQSFLPQAVIADGLLRFPGHPITVTQSVAFDPRGVTRVEARVRIRRENASSTGQEYQLELFGFGPFRDPPLGPASFSVATPEANRTTAPLEWTTVTVGIDADSYEDFALIDELTVSLSGYDTAGASLTPSGPIVDSLEVFATLAS